MSGAGGTPVGQALGRPIAWTFLGACGAAGVAYPFLSVGVTDWLYVAVALASAGALLLGVALHRPRRAFPWLLVACGFLLWVAGDVAWLYSHAVSDAAYLLSYPLLVAGVLGLVRPTRRAAVATFAEAAILAGCAGVVTWVVLVDPLLVAPPVDETFHGLFAAVVPALDVLMLASVAQLLAGSAVRRTPSLRMLVAALCLLLVADVAYAPLLAGGTYVGGGLLDAGWLAAYALAGAAALHPSMLRFEAARSDPFELSPRRFATLGGLCLGVPALLAVSADEPEDLLAFGFFGTLLVLAVWGRMWLLYTKQRGDLDALRASQERLRESRELYRAVVEDATDLIAVADEDGRIVYASPSHARVLGHTPEEMVGRHVLDGVHEEDRGVAEASVAALLDGTTERVGDAVRCRRADGTYASIERQARLTRDRDGRRRLVVVGRDVTERQRLEEQLRQSRQLEAIGQLAGGVAHDFNNLLLAINGFAALALERALEPELRSDLEEIVRAGERGAELTRQLLAFGRRQTLQPQPVDLNDSVASVCALLGRLLGEHIRIEMSPAAGLWPALADPAQVEQVLLNLAVNARDAMPDGGTLTMATANVRVDGARAAELELEPGDYAALSVADTGTGIAEETRPHVFEPFFTTKPQGLGAGLGLSTVYGIVRQSNGAIDVASAPGAGATFTVYLPRTAPARCETAVGAGGGEPGHERILLVEDDPHVRKLTAAMLQRHGYEVTSAEDAETALTRAAGERFDLLVTDVVMPGRNGRQLAETLRLADPSLRVLYISGYAADTLAGGSETAFLPKPFTLRDLGEAVRGALERAA